MLLMIFAEIFRPLSPEHVLLFMTHMNMIPFWNISEVSNADNVLIAVGFYIGERKKYDGALPFVVVAAITVLAMIISEVNFVILCVQWMGKV